MSNWIYTKKLSFLAYFSNFRYADPLKDHRCTSKLIYVCLWTISSSWSNFCTIRCSGFLFHNSTNWLSVPLGELTVKAWKWPINFTLLMNVIEGNYSTIAYILVTFEAYVFLYIHNTNDILPFWPYFMYKIIVLVRKSSTPTMINSWKLLLPVLTPVCSGINNSHELFWSYITYYILHWYHKCLMASKLCQ